MIIVTGGEGFIGSNLVDDLQKRNYKDVISLDIKTKDIKEIYKYLLSHVEDIDCIFHLGAITDTTEMDESKFNRYNLNCSMFIWKLCAENKIPLIYASSAATYGDGKNGFNDESPILNLQPLNPYAVSKQKFDVWALGQKQSPPFWYGLKFFNVYGYGEGHKGKMSSMVLQLYEQIDETKYMKLFKSHNSHYKDGEQLRDFIYVDDVTNICIYMFESEPESGIYNVGTGHARTFNDVAKQIYINYYNLNPIKGQTIQETSKKINKLFEFRERLSYFDIPEKIKDKYQYFTEATVIKLRNSGYKRPFYELEDGIKKYVEKLKS